MKLMIVAGSLALLLASAAAVQAAAQAVSSSRPGMRGPGGLREGVDGRLVSPSGSPVPGVSVLATARATTMTDIPLVAITTTSRAGLSGPSVPADMTSPSSSLDDGSRGERFKSVPVASQPFR